jgi:hypothetical protein
MNANIRTIGGAIGSGVGASLLTTGVTASHPFPADAGYAHVFWLLAGAAVLASLAAMIVPGAARVPVTAQAAVPAQRGAEAREHETEQEIAGR